jgi:hypothetical protein
MQDVTNTVSRPFCLQDTPSLWIRTTETAQIKETETEGFPR